MNVKNICNFFLFSLLLILTTGCSAERPIQNYYEARDLFWSDLYPNGGKSLYCGQKFESNYKGQINIEHVMPMGWVMRELKCGARKECRRNSTRFNVIESDLHNLYPAKKNINKERSSYAFGIVKGEKRKYGKCDFEIDPTGTWYLAVGQGMGAVLKIANDKQAYTLTDRGTWLAYKDKLDLIVISEGDSILFNPYHVIAINPEKHPHAKYKLATDYINFITGEAGQKIIQDFKLQGEQLFYPDAINN